MFNIVFDRDIHEKNIICHHMNRKISHTEIHGTYSGPVDKNDIVESFGSGSRGHRFVFFDAGTFIFVKYHEEEAYA